jgi:Transglutaminase-like superfamily
MLRMAFTYLEISVLARLLPLPKAFAMISSRLAPGQADEVAAGQVVNALDNLLGADLPLLRPQCWRRAAVLHRFLRREGVDTAIVFGVTTDGTPTVEAHAWLERDGVPFAEAPQSKSYRRVFEFGATRSTLS